MSGFIYNGNSTETILDSSSLMLAAFDPTDSVTGVTRENMAGESTMTRPIANEYGTTSTPLSFTYSLVKSNGETFAEDEQIIVERWLTSPKLSSDLKIIDSNGMVTAIYCGKFVSTEWKNCAGGWAGIIFTFENNSPYPKRYFEYTYEITGSGTISLNCETDELEEYIYPTITIVEPTETAEVSIVNVTDNSNTMTVRAYHKLPMVFDCAHCIPSDATTNGLISYADLGWTDVGNIYWLRLLAGENTIEINGNVNITITYSCPYKKVGGWL